jgi:hypothetical protein
LRAGQLVGGAPRSTWRNADLAARRRLSMRVGICGRRGSPHPIPFTPSPWRQAHLPARQAGGFAAPCNTKANPAHRPHTPTAASSPHSVAARARQAVGICGRRLALRACVLARSMGRLFGTRCGQAPAGRVFKLGQGGSKRAAARLDACSFDPFGSFDQYHAMYG